MSDRAEMPDRYDEDISREPDNDETCPKCEGTGMVWSEAYGDWVPCRRCEGVGSIEVP
jgi:DnaJ-class molecular chaperone